MFVSITATELATVGWVMPGSFKAECRADETHFEHVVELIKRFKSSGLTEWVTVPEGGEWKIWTAAKRLMEMDQRLGTWTTFQAPAGACQEYPEVVVIAAFSKVTDAVMFRLLID